MAAPWLPMGSPRACMEAGVRSCVPNPSKKAAHLKPKTPYEAQRRSSSSKLVEPCGIIPALCDYGDAPRSVAFSGCPGDASGYLPARRCACASGR